ncbi:glutathione peroxidase [Saccharomycopsis crataegensis]|uniref:Protein URE2 n=1 Tax=Saccharomycopsis crataegensis TaxID=43959 RepID=A0AAV5QP79_9ASCO|nr:glutathione peroxidase [Saccharomycopsis crataegensis]
MDERPPISNLSYALKSVHISRNGSNNSSQVSSNSNNSSRAIPIAGVNSMGNNNPNITGNNNNNINNNNLNNNNSNNNNGMVDLEFQNRIMAEAGNSSRISNFFQNQPSSGITLFSHRSAPNGFKVAIILSELNFKYQTIFLDFNSGEQRAPEFVSINPNARVPAIIDHDNNDLAIWESGAIILYLVEKYIDTNYNGRNTCTLYSPNLGEKSQILSWLFFQTSGHAPMIGQALHFRYFHSQFVPSAVERYTDEVRRVYGVIEMALAERRESLIMELDSDNAAAYSSGVTPLSQSKFFDYPVWLVGDHVTVADLSFVPWNNVVDRIGINIKEEFPEVYKWTKHMMRRPSVIRALRGE